MYQRWVGVSSIEYLKVCGLIRSMDINFLGHSCFKLRGKTGTVVIDPYEADFEKELGVKLKGLSQDERSNYGELRVWAEGFLSEFLKSNPRVLLGESATGCQPLLRAGGRFEPSLEWSSRLI